MSRSEVMYRRDVRPPIHAFIGSIPYSTIDRRTSADPNFGYEISADPGALVPLAIFISPNEQIAEKAARDFKAKWDRENGKGSDQEEMEKYRVLLAAGSRASRK